MAGFQMQVRWFVFDCFRVFVRICFVQVKNEESEQTTLDIHPNTPKSSVSRRPSRLLHPCRR